MHSSWKGKVGLTLLQHHWSNYLPANPSLRMDCLHLASIFKTVTISQMLIAVGYNRENIERCCYWHWHVWQQLCIWNDWKGPCYHIQVWRSFLANNQNNRSMGRIHVTVIYSTWSIMHMLQLFDATFTRLYTPSLGCTWNVGSFIAYDVSHTLIWLLLDTKCVICRHNIFQLEQFMASIRKSIDQGRFEQDMESFLQAYSSIDEGVVLEDTPMKKKQPHVLWWWYCTFMMQKDIEYKSWYCV